MPALLLRCHMLPSVTSSVFKMQHCLNDRMAELWEILPTSADRYFAAAWKTTGVLRKNYYAGYSDQQRRGGEAERGRRGTREDKMAM